MKIADKRGTVKQRSMVVDNLPSLKSISIVVADDQPIFVEGLRSVLNGPDGKFDIHWTGVANSSHEIRDILHGKRADLLLLDLNIPEPDNLRIIADLKEIRTELRVLVITMHDDPRLVKAAFKAGADGYILKSGTKEELFRAIEEVLEGNTFLGKGVAVTDQANGNASGASTPEHRFSRKFGLTRREMEVMRYIGQAFSNKDIAQKLFISDQTVSVHRKNIMRKLGVKSTANLIKIAYENNLV